MTTKFRGANEQRHQKPYRDNLNLTDVPAGADPFKGEGKMDVLDVDTMAKAEGSNTGTRPQSSLSRMSKRDANEL